MHDKELISALADGQLRGEELARAMQACEDPQGLEAWDTYHLIGDVLRSAEPGRASSARPFLDRLAAQLAQEQSRPGPVPPIQVRQPQPAANDGSFRWKVVAGVASFAAVAAVGWTVAGVGATRPGPQLATAPAAPPAETVLTRSTAGVMIRDPKLDELLAAHRQLGGASALQMPAGFLRNATFEGPDR